MGLCECGTTLGEDWGKRAERRWSNQTLTRHAQREHVDQPWWEGEWVVQTKDIGGSCL